MSSKLFALDMDGTTLGDDHQTISQENMAAIEAAMKAGKIFVPATGRMRAHLPQQIQQLEGWRYAITSNGAAIYDRQQSRLLYSHCLDMETAAAILDFLSPMPVFFEVYCDGDSYVQTERMEQAARYHVPQKDLEMLFHKCHPVENLAAYIRQEGIHLEKIYIPYLDQETNQRIRSWLSSLPVAVTSSVDTNIEVNRKGTSKGDALGRLCQMLGIQPQEVLAVGDNHNDLTMLQFAGTAVAVANGEPEVKAAAGIIAPSNLDNGVAWAINTFLLK